jgi:adenine-specific DNA-methyltransferase
LGSRRGNAGVGGALDGLEYEEEWTTMSNELRSLLARVEVNDPDTAKELRRHIDALQSRRQFGLNFERHTPESVALTGRPISVGDKVRFLPPRGETEVTSHATWIVTDISGSKKKRVASLIDPRTKDEASRAIEDLVFVADFRDPIYPGLSPSDEPVLRGGDKPFHSVINAENYHALEAMLFTYRGKVDCIYIDPPYNTRANDWKYNNDYVDPGDSYAHSKWLAFMERRLKLAKKLLNPRDSVLIVTIDEKEYLRLGLLLEQAFPGERIQMVSILINPKGVSRGAFRRADEYAFFVMLGDSRPARLPLAKEWSPSPKVVAGLTEADDFDDSPTVGGEPGWTSMMRRGSSARRTDRKSMFYPIYADPESARIVEVGEAIPEGQHRAPEKSGLVAILPIRRNGDEGRWQIGRAELLERIEQGRIRLGRRTSYGYVVNYLPDGEYAEALSDKYELQGRAGDGSIVAVRVGFGDDHRVAPTQWKITGHNASEYGSTLLAGFLPGRSFPFPKSLYAVEDTLRFFLVEKPDALVLDFFSGSGTTAHAVMRLNKQDNGRRRSISVTNNEINDQEASFLKRGLRPGDSEWDNAGICERVTKPRIKAAVTGLTPDGQPVKGDYKFTDEFPMSEGFEENVAFFTLTYENPAMVELDMAFERIAPLLWMRAGSQGRIIDQRTDTFDLAETYAVLFNVDASRSFLAAVEKAERLSMAYIVTDDETQYQAIAGQLPDRVESVRLYESYLRTFQINTGRA